jgi:hypothetical protein
MQSRDKSPTSEFGDGLAMSFEQIEQMKRDYTDKYVLVDAMRPELARFRNVVGRGKTVNMSGRALVEFDDYHLNIGWYDIDPEFLKFMDEPPAKVEAKKAAPAAKQKATVKGAAPAAKGGRPSVADMLAAARGGGAAKPAGDAPAKAKAAGATAAAKPAAGKVDRSKMSVADMLAAARAGGATGSGGAAAPNAPAEEPAATSKPATKPKVAAAVATANSGEKVDKSKMSIDEMVAWCRAHDTK